MSTVSLDYQVVECYSDSCICQGPLLLTWFNTYPTLARGLQGFRVRGFFSNAGTHGHTHQLSQSGQSRSRPWPITQCPIARTWESSPNNAQSCRFSRTDRRLSRQFWDDQVTIFDSSKCGIKTKTHFEWLLLTPIFTRSFELRTLTASWVAKCQLASWRSVSKKPRTLVFII